MIIKVGDGYLEINDLIEIEKKVRLFEEFSVVQGDFSYSFTIPRTQNNERLIEVFSINNILRPWNKKIPAQVLSDGGAQLYNGFLRVEDRVGHDYQASFFSGNTNWIDELNFNILDIDWSDFDKPGSQYFTTTEGIVTPLTDRGGILVNRKSPLFDRSDLQPYFYVKDLIKRVLLTRGIKMVGDILINPDYNKLATAIGVNKYLQSEIDKREVYAGKSGTQVITSSYSTVTFTNVSSPFFNSELNNWNTANSRYTFDIETKSFSIELNLIFDSASYFVIRVLKNGTDEIFEKGYNNVKTIKDTLGAEELNENPSAGDYYEVQARMIALFADRTMVAGSSIRIKPVQFWKIFAGSIVPDITGSALLSNVFKMFNYLISYNENTKTITTTSFDKILNSNPIDLSEYLTINTDNFEEFTSDYFKQNLMTWGEQSTEEVEIYNEQSTIPYGAGVINVDNDFLEDSGDIIEMDFTAPFQKLYGFLGMDLVATEFVTYRTKYTVDLNSVTDSAGTATFHHDSYPPGGTFSGIIRISESTIEDYNGDYFAITVNAFNGRTAYLGNASGKIEFLEASFTGSDPVFVLVEANQNIGDISGVDSFTAGSYGLQTVIAVAHFLDTVNFQSSLSFDVLKNKYFSSVESILNTGVKCYATGNITEKQYNDIDFTRTVRINDSVFFVQVIRGYKGSKYPVELELIKIR